MPAAVAYLEVFSESNLHSIGHILCLRTAAEHDFQLAVFLVAAEELRCKIERYIGIAVPDFVVEPENTGWHKAQVHNFRIDNARALPVGHDGVNALHLIGRVEIEAVIEAFTQHHPRHLKRVTQFGRADYQALVQAARPQVSAVYAFQGADNLLISGLQDRIVFEHRRNHSHSRDAAQARQSGRVQMEYLSAPAVDAQVGVKVVVNIEEQGFKAIECRQDGEQRKCTHGIAQQGNATDDVHGIAALFAQQVADGYGAR